MPDLNEHTKLIHIKVYVEDEFVTNISSIKNEKFPNTSIAEYIEQGYDEIIYWNDYSNLPTRGMIYNGETFIDGENGETFRKHMPAFDFNLSTFIFIKNNKVLGYHLLTDNFPLNEIVVAALKSNPTFELISEL